jgi:regulator of sigma E protease
MILTIIAFIVVLGVLILVHEFGHFIVAKLVGIKVEEFAFGFPPRIWSVKKGETNYSLNLVPIGGYVKMLGEDGESQDPRAFSSQSVFKRLLVVVAGVTMNIILAVVLITIGFLIGMAPLQSQPKDLGGTEKNLILITQIMPHSPAQKAHLLSGDKVISVVDKNGRTELGSVEDLQNITKQNATQTITLNIVRDNQDRAIKVNLDDGKTPLGVGLVEDTSVKLPFLKAVRAGFIETWKSIVAIVMFVVTLIVGFFHGSDKVGSQVGGPVAVYSFTSEAVKLGLAYVIQLAALLSINLAVINILPIPALDGGRGLFILLEGIFGKKVIKPNTEGIIHTVGFALLIILIIIITVHDVLRFY